MTNSADPDQSASSEADWSGSTVCKHGTYPCSGGPGLKCNKKYKLCYENKNSNKKMSENGIVSICVQSSQFPCYQYSIWTFWNIPYYISAAILVTFVGYTIYISQEEVFLLDHCYVADECRLQCRKTYWRHLKEQKQNPKKKHFYDM